MDELSDIRRAAVAYAALAAALAGPAALAAWPGRWRRPGLAPAAGGPPLEAVVAAALTFFLCPVAAYSALRASGLLAAWAGGPVPADPAELGPRWPVRFGLAAAVAAALPSAALLSLLARPSPGRLPGSLAAGYLGWLALAPVVFAAHFAANAVQAWATGRPPEPHPYLALIDEKAPRLDWLLLVASAVVAAPLTEELLFRGALLPYLAGDPRRADLGMGVAVLLGVLAGGAEAGPAAFALVLTLAYHALPATEVRAVWVTASLFALLHANVWPTPVPLFALGLGLGWAARATGGVAAPVVLHALFNATSCLALALA